MSDPNTTNPGPIPPSIGGVPIRGAIVHYTLTESNAADINRRRADGALNLQAHRMRRDGSMVHVGNEVKAGMVFPAIVVQPWGGTPLSAANLQVFLDGSDTFWATSVSAGEGPGHWVP